MRKSASIGIPVGLGALVFAGGAWAFPSCNQRCTDCRLINAGVRVTGTNMNCYRGAAGLYVTVTNTFSGGEGRAVFQGTTNLRNGYGSMGTLTLPASANLSAPGRERRGPERFAGRLQPGTADRPSCPLACTGGDGDTSSIQGGTCGPVDCDYTNPGKYPGDPEIIGDVVDQDCNGCDLTIVVTTATWSESKKRLTVTATSGHGASAALQVVSCGAMTWNPSFSTWSLTASTSSKLASVTVRGPEGQVSAAVTQVR